MTFEMTVTLGHFGFRVMRGLSIGVVGRLDTIEYRDQRYNVALYLLRDLRTTVLQFTAVFTIND